MDAFLVHKARQGWQIIMFPLYEISQCQCGNPYLEINPVAIQYRNNK